jgi:hypothetical protein
MPAKEPCVPAGPWGNRIVEELTMAFHRAGLGLAALAALSAGTAFAAVGQAPQGGVAATGTDDKDAERMVCRSLTVSGSRVPQRVCATKTEWEEHAKRASQGLEDSQQESDRRSFVDPKSLPR